MTNRKNWLKKCLCILLCLAAVCIVSLAGINAYVIGTTKNRILTVDAAAELTDVDCILVLGCGVWDDGTPSHMLEDRLVRALELYEQGAAPKLLMSGDHGREDYDEVNAMKTYAVEAGVPSQDIFMDHAGFSTYESMYRAGAIFRAGKVIIVSQGYHLYRAIYIARAMGLDAYGVAADYRPYAGEVSRQVREALARVKDVGTTLLRVEPTYLGEVIPIWGNGDITNDEASDFS